MRKSMRTAMVLGTSVALVGGFAFGSAEARTAKDMRVCWTSPTGTNYPIKVVLDGPTSRSKTLVSGECKSWNVKGGEYKVIWANLDQMYDTFQNAPTPPQAEAAANVLCGAPPVDGWDSIRGKAYVKRFKSGYTTQEVNNVFEDNATGIRTTVQNNRQTKVNFRLQCRDV